ncbi:MAG: hypothetical protein MRJ68_16160 [Nitrospira sp.]|nr:hypothetical protein [Nitrospira sp.]
MQIVDGAMSRMGAWRTIALLVVLVLGIELSLPVCGYAQQDESSAPTPVMSLKSQGLPPMQEAETVDERKPYYKTWWFWAIVGSVVASAAAGAALAIGGSDPGPTGTVTITGPPPR